MTTPAPLPGARRSAAQDVARGLALLLAALAGSVQWLTGRREGPGLRPLDASSTDHAVDLVVTLLADNRAYPLFALLLGCGAARFALRWEAELGPGGVRDALARRGLGLLGLGLLHALLLSDADVLGSLGVLLLLTAVLVRVRTAVLVLVAVLLSPGLAVLGAVDGVGGQLGGLPDVSSSYPVSVLDRGGSWFANLVLLLPFGTVGLLTPVLLGVLLVRSGWLDEPSRHRRGLAVTAGLSGACSLVGALPLALVTAQVVDLPLAGEAVAGSVSWLSGVAGAVAVSCAVAVLLPAAPGRLVRSLGATGRLTLSGYVLTSLVLGVLAAPWALGYGSVWGSSEVAAVALVTWSMIVLLASWWDGAGRQGPLEAVRSSVQPCTAQGRERQGRSRRSAT